MEWTYNSNGIEGNTLTKIVLEGITVGGKTMREHLEAVNHRDAIGFLEQLVHDRATFDERDIKDIHSLVLRSGPVPPPECTHVWRQHHATSLPAC